MYFTLFYKHIFKKEKFIDDEIREDKEFLKFQNDLLLNIIAVILDLIMFYYVLSISLSCMKNVNTNTQVNTIFWRTFFSPFYLLYYFFAHYLRGKKC